MRGSGCGWDCDGDVEVGMGCLMAGGIYWVVSASNAFQVELRSGRVEAPDCTLMVSHAAGCGRQSALTRLVVNRILITADNALCLELDVYEKNARQALDGTVW